MVCCPSTAGAVGLLWAPGVVALQVAEDAAGCSGALVLKKGLALVLWHNENGTALIYSEIPRFCAGMDR